jgi:hypothetical protein
LSIVKSRQSGPGGTRTPDLHLTTGALYPSELRGHSVPIVLDGNYYAKLHRDYDRLEAKRSFQS